MDLFLAQWAFVADAAARVPPEQWVFGAAILTAGAAVFGTVWVNRRNAPDSLLQIQGLNSTLLASAEARIVDLVRENQELHDENRELRLLVEPN